MNQIEKMWGKIYDFEYVSFDIFDTLLFRTVLSPEDVFDIVQYIYNKKHDNKIRNFKETRIRYEIKLRNSDKNREITLEKIYNSLPYTEEIKKELCYLEKHTEINSCIPNTPMLELMQKCSECNKKIIIVSDMYLDRDTIEKMLRKIGITCRYRLFLSSEEGVTKKSGRLFPKVIDILGVKSSDIIHFGDNEYSDIKMAEKAGIKAETRLICTKDIDLYQRRNNTIKYKHLDAIFKNEYRGEDVSEYRIGYTVVGPLLYAFCDWLHEQKTRNNYEKVFFVSREGYLIQKIYKEMFPDDTTQYIYLNKNLLRFPLLNAECSMTNLINTLPIKDTYSIIELLNVLYVGNNEKYYKKFRDVNMISRKDIVDGKYDDVFKEVFDDVKEELEKQNEYLLGYLKQEGFFDGRNFLVNNSINGNGQMMIKKILQKNNISVEILGVQFVKSRKCREALQDKCISWISDSNLSGRYTMKFNRYALLLEHIMFEPSGTAVRFDRDIDGKNLVICASQQEESNNNTLIQNLQENAIRFVHDYKRTVPLKLSVKTIKTFDYLFRYPKKHDINLLKNIYDVDYDGSDLLYLKMNWKQIQYKEGNNLIRLFFLNLYEEMYDELKASVSVIKRKVNEIRGK